MTKKALAQFLFVFPPLPLLGGNSNSTLCCLLLFYNRKPCRVLFVTYLSSKWSCLGMSEHTVIQRELSVQDKSLHLETLRKVRL